MRNKNDTNGLNGWGRFRYSVYEFFRRLGEPFQRKKKSAHMRNMKHSLWLFAYLVLALPILHFFIFYVYVNFDGVALAFKDVSTGALTFGNFRYVFKELVSGGSEMFTAIKNTFAFWMLGWILMPINILVSFLLYKKLPGYKFFQVVFFLPSIIGGVVWMTAYKNFIMPSGPLCKVLVSLGVFEKDAVPEFLANSSYALKAVLSSNIWLGIPANMLIYCGSLARIPHEIIEAGKLDGVGFWQEIRLYHAAAAGAADRHAGGAEHHRDAGRLGEHPAADGGTETARRRLSYWFYDQIVVGGNYNVPAAMGLLMTLFTLPFRHAWADGSPGQDRGYRILRGGKMYGKIGKSPRGEGKERKDRIRRLFRHLLCLLCAFACSIRWYGCFCLP